MAQFGSGRAGRPKNDRVVFHHFTGEEVHDIIETLELFNPCTLNECQQMKYAQVYSYLSTIVERPAEQQELEVLSSSPKPSTSGLPTPAPVFARPASTSLKRHRDPQTTPAPATVSSKPKLPFDSRPMISALNESMKKTHVAPSSAEHAHAPSQPSQSSPVAPIEPHVPVKAPSQPSHSAPVAPIEPHVPVKAPSQPSHSAPVAPIEPHVPVKAPSQPSHSAPVAPIEPHVPVKAPSQPSQSAPVAPIEPHVPVKAPSQPSQSAPVAPIEPRAPVKAPTHHKSPAGEANTEVWRYNGLPLTRADCNTLINIFGQVINNANVDEDTAEEILEVMLYINKKFKEEDI